MRFFDNRFNAIYLLLENRNISEDDLSKEKIATVVTKSKEIATEEMQMNYAEKDTVEICRLLEESYNEKSKTFKLKKQIMENIKKMKEAQKTELSKLFDKLNQIEDEYIVTEKFLANIQVAIKQNSDEIRNATNRITFVSEEKQKMEIRKKHLEEDLNCIRNDVTNKNEESSKVTKQIEDIKKIIEIQMKEAQELHVKLISDKLILFEHQERSKYIDLATNNLHKEVGDLTKSKTKKEDDFSTRLATLKDIVKNKTKSEDELRKLDTLLKTIELGENSKPCLCELKDEYKNAMLDLINKTETVTKTKQTYIFYEQMIADFIAEKDTNLNHFVGLTISSHMSQKDKITKITQIYHDRNVKLVDFLADLLLKNNVSGIKNYFTFAVHLKRLNLDKMLTVMKTSKDLMDSIGSLNPNSKTDQGMSLKLAINLSKQLDDGLSSVVDF